MVRLLSSLVLALAALVRPASATWSIILIDVRTGEIAVASATCLTSFDLAVFVPVVVVGRGAGCAQSFVDQSGQTRIYIRDQLRLGTSPAQILAGLAGLDPGHQTRQYGIVDVSGRAIGFTGTGAGAFASDRTGRIGDLAYAIQGNVLTGGAVLAAAEIALYSTPGDLATKLMAAMEAARQYGGDGRCSCSENTPTACGSPPPSFTKSSDIAFMIVARPGDIDGSCNASVGCANGSYYMRLNVANQPRSAPDPVVQLRGLFDQWRAQQRGRVDQFASTFSFGVPTLPVNGLTVVRARLELRDREGTRITSGATNVQVSVDPSSTTNATLGAVVNNNDGSYDVPVTAGTLAGRLVLNVTLDDGRGARPLAPRPEIATIQTTDRLWASRTTLSAASGGRVEFAINAGPFFGANRTWVLLASSSGTRPGLTLPPFYNLPLNYDPLFQATLLGAFFGIIPELAGRTSSTGAATTGLTFPRGIYDLPVGTDVAFAYALIDPVNFTSNAVSFRVVQ